VSTFGKVNNKTRLGVVNQACNSSYLGSGGSRFKARSNKKLVRPQLRNKPDMVIHTCNSSYAGDIDGRNMVQSQPGQKLRNPT
jgi:hypothetical protein